MKKTMKRAVKKTKIAYTGAGVPDFEHFGQSVAKRAEIDDLLATRVLRQSRPRSIGGKSIEEKSEPST